MTKINLDQLILAMEECGRSGQYYVNRQNGEIFGDLSNEIVMGEVDEDDLIELPGQDYFHDYENMQDFAMSRSSNERDWLLNAIAGRGAFRRFRGACERLGLQKEWYDYLEHAHLLSAVSWCEENGFSYDLDDLIGVDEQEKSEVEGEHLSNKEAVLRITDVTSRNIGTLTSLAAAYLYETGKTEKKDMQAAEDWLEGEKSAGKIYSALQQGVPYGFAAVRDSGTQCYLEAVYVEESSRNKGIGRALVERAEENGDLICLVPYGMEDALAFLDKIGYGKRLLISVAKKGSGE